MGKIEYFTIILKNPTAVYLSGESIIGQLRIKIGERIKINSVKFSAIGYGRVHWIEHIEKGKQRRTIDHTSIEEYLNFNVLLKSKEYENEEFYLEVGEHTFTFEVVLPNSLPTSFEHQFGRVRYSLNGTIDIPWSFDKYTQRSITIVNTYDLNNYPNLKQPFGVSATKVFCCGICKSDPLTIKFIVPKVGFVSGESIPFKVIFDNKSSREITKSFVSLIQIIKFRAPKKTKTCTRYIQKLTNPKVIPGKILEEWNGSISSIPPLCSTTIDSSIVIGVSYFLEFIFDAKGPSIDADIKIPITIGTIPFKSGNGSTNVNLISFVACMFSAIPKQNEDQQKGDMIESDLNTYKPFYPFYKNVSQNK